jgi:hypothetical protein
MTDKKLEFLLNLIDRDGERDGYTKEELEKSHLGLFTKLTKSKRIMRMVKLAYYKGMKKGVKMVKELETPITFR